MVNVDISPSVVLGVGLIGAGVSLWQIRRVKPWLSKDYDVVVSCISLLVGGILIFQGWRLDPLLLFGQLMTTGAAVSFAIEALRLRSEAYEGEEKAALQDVFMRKGGPRDPGGAGSAFQLPPPDADGSQQPWAQQEGQQPWADQRQWAPAGQQQQQQDGYAGFDASQPPAWGDGAPQQWDYGSGGYQPAEYQAYDDGGAAGGADGGDFFGGGSSSSSSGVARPPIEFTFPASYDDGSSAGPAAAAAEGTAGPASDGSWGGPADQQQAPQQPKQQPPAAPGRRGSSFDTMDDW